MAKPSATSRPAPAEEPFILTAMLSLVAASAWMALRPRLFLGFFYSGELLAITHLVTLGFITSIVMGILVRLVPMVVGVSVASRPLALLQFALHLVGATGMLGSWSGVAWSTLVMTPATLVQLINFRPLIRPALAGDWTARYALAAMLQLVLAAGLGSFIAWNKTTGFAGAWLEAPPFDLLSAHFHLAAVGWVTTLIVGFQIKLFPITARSLRREWLRFALLEVGLLGLVASLIGGLGLELPFAVCLVLVAVRQAAQPLRVLHKQRTWRWETVALAALVVAAAMGLGLAADIPPPGSVYRPRLQLAYGYTALFGWVLLTVSSTAFKLFPLWVWKERFEAAALGGERVPAVRDLYSKRLVAMTGSLLGSGVLAMIPGVLAASERLVTLAVWLVFAGVACFVANFIRTARWGLMAPRPAPK